MNIDWSKAPEGATGAMVANFDSRNEGGTTWVGKVEFVPYGSETRDSYTEGEHAWTYYERPVPWKGEGLPPVGLPVEWYSDSQTGWQEIIVLAYHGMDAWIKPKGRSSTIVGNIANFRPIRTPEQIAAEERERAVADMKSVFDLISHELMPTSNQYLETLFGAMYDAGYRKFEIVEGDV